MTRGAWFSLVVTAAIGGAVLMPSPATAQVPAETRPLAVVELPALDLAAVQAEDAAREAAGLAPRFAIPNETIIRPETDGTWEELDGQARLWRLRISAPGALSLNLGFTAYYMPAGGELRVYAADGSYDLPPFTAADNAAHGELWTPVVLADDIIVQVMVPKAGADELRLELTAINVGYRAFGEMLPDKSGACNVDVICPEGDNWRNEIPTVAVISTGGSLFCTGFMVNNVRQDMTPYFMTANHCGISSGNAASLVVYWNFQSPTCGQHGGGSLSQSQTGSYFRATYSASDFTLVELDSLPSPAWNITYAGWDRSTNDPTSATAIHHPDCDEKSISFEYQACTTTSYLGTSVPGDGTHIRVIDWDVGTTEPGSSGSPLFDQNHRVVGQLHGGYAACGNNSSDWYGRFSKSWTGGGTNASRLSNWLDPDNTGAVTVDTLGPGRLVVEPEQGLDAAGEVGGPFAPNSILYSLSNPTSTAIDFTVGHLADWVTVSPAAGQLGANGHVTVTVSINANAAALVTGRYSDVVTFTNTTNHSGDTTRTVDLQVGFPARIHHFPLDTNPGWTTAGEWAFGQPTGQGGLAHGNPDPTAGATGLNVYGVNLNGDYATTIGGPYYLTMGPLDLSGATESTLKFQRWLNSDYQPYAYATIQVSATGTTWTDVWTNGTTLVRDAAWTQQAYSIAVVADHQPQVWLRWGYRIANGAYAYSGWNIDDIEIWAFAPPVLIDCNANGIADATDISSGTSWDDDANGVPDECENAPGDLNCDGTVSFGDINPFVLLLSNEAAYVVQFPGCLRMNGDVNGDGTVSFSDINPFVMLLSQR
ncbi:MAG TPA: trypsin-like peptidase domain-containing protein [Phycisphaerae bacterium]|nr:trypsin-like peptidase domain-containing protein [Phycisphaerae bacterium]